MNVLIYRPQPAASRTARAIEALGHHTYLYPLFNLVTQKPLSPTEAYDNVIITSEAVFQVGVDLTPYLDYPLYVVGQRTYDAAVETGFNNVHAATETSPDLSERLLRTHKNPEHWLYICGVDRKSDLERRLTQEGHTFTVWEAYASRAMTQLPPALAMHLATGHIDIIVHYSLRSAEVFRDLVRNANLINTLAKVHQVVISESIKRVFQHIPVASMHVAIKPDEDALLETLKALAHD